MKRPGKGCKEWDVSMDTRINDNMGIPEMNELEYEPLTNDILFHKVFSMNSKALRGLLSSVLNIPEEEILDVEIQNPMQYTDAFVSKLTIMDLRLHLNNDKYVNVEMQVRRFDYWTNRTLTYSCRQLAEQTNKEGFDYGSLEPVIQIAIMNYTLFPDHKRFFAKYELKDEEGYLYSDKLRFCVMDLTALSLVTEEERNQGLEAWGKAFTAKTWEQVEKIENPAIKEVVKQMRVIMADPDEREIIMARKMAELDMRSLQQESEAKGEARGLERGKLQTLIDLVKDGLLTVATAAQKAGLTEDGFKKAMNGKL